MKRIVLALIPCQKGKCGARARPFTNSFINSAFLSLSVFPNETVDNKKTEVDLSNRDLRRIRREEQKNKPTENFEINKVSKGVFNSKSRLAKKMIEFSRASEFPMDILRLTREKKSNSSFYVAYFNRTKPLFNHNKNIFVLPTHNKSNQLIGSLKDYFTNYAQGYDFKFYNVGERVFAESRKKDISGIDVKLELNESLNFIQQHTPSIIENNKRRVVGHDVISCQKNQCINFDVLNVELLPLFKAKHRLKVDTYIDINKIPKTDFIYVGFIEFEANIEIDLEI